MKASVIVALFLILACGSTVMLSQQLWQLRLDISRRHNVGAAVYNAQIGELYRIEDILNDVSEDLKRSNFYD